jgi:hypothetical protein
MKWNEKLYEWTKNYTVFDWCVVALLLIVLLLFV